MAGEDFKADLHRCLRVAREALLWKLDGLSEYDVRRPLTFHGTNLLGLVKHLSGCEIGYFGWVFDRPFPDPPAWLAVEDDATIDMWVRPEETRADIVDLYRRACAHADVTIETLGLGDRGLMPDAAGGRSVTLHHVLVHMVAETTRHAGHADIVRELIDDAAGAQRGSTGLPDEDWPRLRQRIEDAANEARAISGER